MAHGRALQYVGDHSRHIPGVPQMDLLPEAEDALPFDVGEDRWTFAKLVATGDYAWAPVAEVAESDTLGTPTVTPEPTAPEKSRVPFGSKPRGG